MIPSVGKLCEDVSKLIASPLTEGMNIALKEGVKEAKKRAFGAMAPVNQNIARYKENNVYNSEDLVVVTVAAQMLYDKLLSLKINNVSLRDQKGDTESFPLSFFLKDAVVQADLDLHATVEKVRGIRKIFDTVIPSCVAALTASSYMDLKSLASKFSSMMIADGIVIRDALDTCKYGIEVCDKGLKWAGQYDHTVNEWLRAHKLTSTHFK